nr:DEAD/DEAH box helicase family protein [Jannaschia sp. Os4]
MRFRHPWRAYQARVLADLEGHMDDDRLHVVAAPGAGKTVLGLEVMRRLGRPALILSPSLAIRNQWIDRLADLFLDGARPGWVSTDLRAPAPMTVATYQALHALGDLAPLAEAGFGTLILDEAHHLRRAWWAALADLGDRVDARSVALTATPPYDVSGAEWRRYDALAGPVDAEIGVPELVRTGDLVPHRDLVRLVRLPPGSGHADLARADADLRAALRGRADLCDLLLGHPWMRDPHSDLDALLSAPDLVAAMIVYLADAGRDPPAEALRVLGLRGIAIPPVTDAWLQTLCGGLRDDLPAAVVALLRRHGALARGRVSIPPGGARRRTMLRDAPDLFEAVRDAVDVERGTLGPDLRMAILCEHVGAGAVTLAAQEPGAFAPDAVAGRVRADRRAGRPDAGTTFERLRAGPGAPDDLGVLTGSLCIAPAAAPRGEGVAARPLPHDPRYVRLTFEAGADRVARMSDLVAAGHVRVLIGTRALLGQGWDLPALNALVLATNVASFVSSNQMRGRAIRRDPAAPGKTANIWHVAVADPEGGGPEVDDLRARFDTFVHLDPVRGSIRSGWLSPGEADPARQAARARDGAGLARAWDAALEAGGPSPRLRHRVATATAPRGLVRTDVLTRAVPRIGAAAALGVGWGTLSGGLWTGVAALAAAGALAVPTAPSLLRLARHGTLAGSLGQAGAALLHAMAETGLVRTPRAALSVETGTEDGLAWAALRGGTLPEETRFQSLLADLLGPVGNPRYLLLRESYLGDRLRIAPHAVPGDLGRNRDGATALLDGWRRHVGPARLAYTRTVEGRHALLRARMVQLADAPAPRRGTVWA